MVVRGGRMDEETLQAAALYANEDKKVQRYELSFFVGQAGESVEGLVERVGRIYQQLRRYRTLRQSTTGRLSAAGFELVDCDQHGHCQIVFDDAPSTEQLARLASTFDEPEPNPARRSET